jgi:hypothetical protein
MALPDLSHFRNPDPIHIVPGNCQTSVSELDTDPGRPKRSPKIGK